MMLDDVLTAYRDETLRAAAPVPLPDLGAAPQPPVPDRMAPGLFDMGFTEVLRANSNLLTSAHDWMLMTGRLAEIEDDPGFNVFRDYDLTGMEQFAYQFGWAKSRAEADFIKGRLVEDAAARKAFSELGPWTQLIAGGAASIGPLDVLPFAALPRGVLAAGAVLGAATGVQSAARFAMATSPGTAEDVGMDAAMGMIFGSGYRATQRLISGHGPKFEAYSARADQAEARAAAPEAAPAPEPVAPVRVQPDPDLAPAAPRDPTASPRVTPEGDGTIELPKASVTDRPFFIVDEGVEPPVDTLVDHRKQLGEGGIASPKGAERLVLDEPGISDGKTVFDPLHAPFVIVDGDVTVRPLGLSATDAQGVGTARPVPSAHEVVTGRISDAPFETRAVRLEDGPATVGRTADEAAEDIAAGRPVVIRDESSVGARQATRNIWTDEDSKLVSAGGLERLGLTPALRGLNSANPDIRDATAALVNHGMLQRGNVVGLASEQSVESRYYALHAQRITQAVHGFWEDFREFSKSTLATGSRTLDFGLARLANAGQGTSYKAFMREVGLAVLDGGAHTNPAVEKAAQRFISGTAELRSQADAVGYWEFLYDLRIDELSGRMAQTKSSLVRQRLAREIADVTAEKAAAAQAGGPLAKGDAGYLPRYYRHDKIMAERAQVEAIFDRVIQQKNIRDPLTRQPYTGKEAVDILLNIDPFTHQPRPYVKPKGDPWAHSARDRGFDWMPTREIADYIETDAEVLFRRYVRQMGIDIELTSRFGDPFMMKEIQRLAAAGADPKEMEDVMFLRDVLRGTHAPMDPTSILTHSTQAAKMVANAVVLGSQVITAFTDLARPFMTEGIQRTFGASFDALSSGFHGIKAWRREAELLGSTGEMVQSLRAQAFANGNSAMAGTPGWLQAMERSHAGFFMLNGIAPWTEIMKTWQSLVTASRVMDHVEQLAAGTLTDAKALTKLAAIGIDERNAAAIAEQLAKHQVWVGKTRLPNVAAWDDLKAAGVFRTAAWQATNNSIITPGAANISRWMVEGTDWLPPHAAQVLSMYHNYGLALHQRLLVAGLQGADANFLSGAMALVTLGYMVDHLRGEMNAVGDRKPRYKSTAERLTDAVDRSGLLGYLTNINNAVERLSFNTVGVRPFTGQVNFGSGSFVSAMGGLGPVGGWAGNLYRTLNGTAHGRQGWAEAQAMRRLLPLQNVFWADGLFDQLQEEIYVSAEERRTIARDQKARYKAIADAARE